MLSRSQNRNQLYRNLASVFAFISFLIGTMGLLGWFFDIDFFKSILPHFPTMKFNTSLCISILSLLLITFYKKWPPRFRSAFVTILTVMVFAIGLATLVEYIWNINLGIDQFVYIDQGHSRSTPPGRMSFITALVITFTSASFFMRQCLYRLVYVWQSLAVLNIILLSVALLGYMYSASSLARIYPYSSIAIHTCVALICLNAGFLLQSQAVGIMPTFTSLRTGGRMARRLLPLSVFALISLGFLTRVGNQLQFYDASFDAVFIVVFGSVILSWMLWRKAKVLNDLDRSLELRQKILTKSYAESKELSEHLQLLIEHSPAAVAMMDLDMKYIWASQRWIKDFHLEGKELIGQSHYKIFPEIPPRWKEIHRRCLAGATERNDEEAFVRSDGRTNWLRWEVCPWYRASGVIGGIVMFSEDISERKHAAQIREKADMEYKNSLKKLNEELEGRVLERTKEIEKLYSEAKLATKAREAILSIVSHDLKNPVATVDLLAELLIGAEGSNTDVASIARRLKNSSLIMQRLISDLLDFGKIEAGNLTVERAIVSAKAVIDGCLEGLIERASEKNIRVTVEAPAEWPNILCDKDRIIQVLWNLIGNALKFTPRKGSVIVRVEVEDQVVNFTVKDTGPGIESQNLSKVFEMFWQEKKTATLGTGLGLAIAKGIVEAHGGRIWVESESGQGSQFHFSVPLVKPVSVEPILSVEQKSISLDGVHVLLVDDSLDNLYVLKLFLEKAGAKVTQSLSAAEALFALTREKPDVMVTDIEMPDCNGYELLRKVRASAGDEAHHLPVAALTGHTREEETLKIIKAGFDALLFKPVSKENLILTLYRLVKRNHKEKSIPYHQ